MRVIIFIITHLFLASLCVGQTPSYKIIKGDTCNRVNSDGKKQGKWLVFSKFPKCNADGIILEKGVYLDDHKTGVWKEYYCTGIVKTKITFNNGRPEGQVYNYYENGNLHESGMWKNKLWVAKYKEYDHLGKVIRMQEIDGPGKKAGLKIFDCTEAEPFLLNGEAIIYNSKKQILKQGVFKDNLLMEGKAYTYDEKGELARTSLYSLSIYVGDIK